MYLFSVLVVSMMISESYGFQINAMSRIQSSNSQINTALKRNNFALFGTRQRAWAKGDLSDKDIFEAEDDLDGPLSPEKQKLQPEITFFEGPPSASELLFPALSIITVIGIIPFISALSHPLWVRYKITSRRINITSGIGGNDESTIIYPDIEEVRFVFRALGESGDMVLFLKDGAKVEMRHVPNFVEVLQYVLDQCDDEAKEKSMKIPASMIKSDDSEAVSASA